MTGFLRDVAFTALGIALGITIAATTKDPAALVGWLVTRRIG